MCVILIYFFTCFFLFLLIKVDFSYAICVFSKWFFHRLQILKSSIIFDIFFFTKSKKYINQKKNFSLELEISNILDLEFKKITENHLKDHIFSTLT